ncbi:hypothetical protein [Paracoccus haeundaensis]|uniref:Uncharacterized protein n=1 Tax=Paracoccus haeundaensis TaxID=225362 RepID=A0A5C4RBC8_9RHOB|nr:hypothetical protein [Paracoccus haeundaensis]TNH40961.1 hypothetical protein FHD67_02795 [Paracoccus haeundaensis]
MIQNNPTETALVIAGAWNTAILSPEWVLRHGLQRQAEERVQVLIPAGVGMIFEFPRYNVGDFSYVVRPDALIVAPPETSEASIAACEDAVARMIDVLKHTPVSGLGHNFEFRDEAPSDVCVNGFTAARQDLVDQMPQGWDAASASINSSFRNHDGSVIVNISRTLDAGIHIVKFNYHHVIASVEQALQVLRGESDYRRMWTNYAQAAELVNQLYGEEDNGH